MSRSRHFVGLSIAILALAGSLAPADPQPEDSGRAQARKQLELARQALRDFDLLYKNGEVALYDPRVSLWERRQVEALRATGAGKAEVVAALQRYAERMKSIHSTVRSAYERDQLTRMDVHEANYRLLEAEAWLERERSR